MSQRTFVFVPSYNHAPFIEECLRSIFSQTLPPLRLLVIDDGSSDDSPQIIERVLKDCPFDSELIVRENRGLCRTLNEGFSRSEGEYFAYIGSDDFWLPEFIEARTRMLDERADAVLGYGHAYMVDENGDIFDSTTNYSDSWANYPDGSAKPMLIRGIAPISSSVFYRRSALENVAWNEESRLEDYEMYLRLSRSGSFAFDPSVLSAWRQHRYNTSGNRLLMLEELLAAQERNFNLLDVSRETFKKMQTRTKFLYARIELQHGDKTSAMKLAGANWRGAETPAQLVRFALRMMTPMAAVDLYRKLKRNRSGNKA